MRMNEPKERKRTRRWRDYRTSSGATPLESFFEGLSDEEAAVVLAEMKAIASEGLVAARHLRGEIYEVRAEATKRSFRVLFATEGKRSQVLLSLSAFEKRTQKTPPREIDTAERRLRDWRARSRRSNDA